MRRNKPTLAVLSLIILGIGGCQQTPGVSPATQPAIAQPAATQPAIAAAPLATPIHPYIIISGQSGVQIPNGNPGPAIIYIIDEAHDLLSCIAYDSNGHHLEFLKGAIALDRIPRGVAHAGDMNAEVAGGIQGRKYTAFTSRMAQGGDALYLVDRHGIIMVFTFDLVLKRIVPIDVKSVNEAFR